jgi:arabinogalactan endo-1,4-beta-galactosidase
MSYFKKILTLTAISVVTLFSSASTKYVGGDISLLPEYSNATYKDHSGNTVSPLSFFKEQGLNAMRVRLFVNPSDYTGSDKDPNACQDLAYVKSLGKQIKDAGFKLMLDFHYSDTWADPVKQWTPTAWTLTTDEELCQKIYDYTKEVLQELKAAGAEPDFIQTGNEISYGMLWGAYGTSSSQLRKVNVSSTKNWTYFTNLLKKAGDACREECPNAKIVIHIERVAQPSVIKAYYEKIAGLVDYDIIGLSYYPYFHGNLSQLEAALTQAETFNKEIMIVETGYPYAWEVPGTTIDCTSQFPYTDEGQRSFTESLINVLNQHELVTGLFWWWMEYNAYGAGLSGWYNAPLFDSRTGRATSALSELKKFLNGDDHVNGVLVDEDNDGYYYDLNGHKYKTPTEPGIYIKNGKKYIIK